MIVKEIININGVEFAKFYSNNNVLIKDTRSQAEFSEAITFVFKNAMDFEETDKLIANET
ncbi:MAG: hypothetical protein WC366_05075 [Bacilli bacterium]|jgi:hypothetical protein